MLKEKFIDEVSKVIMEESAIKFANGTVLNGSADISGFLYDCCVAAIQGAMSKQKRYFLYGAAAGVAAYVTYKVIKKSKKG